MFTSRRGRLAVATLLAIMLGGLTLASALAKPSDLQLARAATARFNSIAQAEAAGYGLPLEGPLHECIANLTGPGAMGFHLINGDLLDTTVDPAHPGGARLRPRQAREAQARRGRIRRLPGALAGGVRPRRHGADALRSDVHADTRTESVRDPGVLCPARVALADEPGRHVRELQPQRQLLTALTHRHTRPPFRRAASSRRSAADDDPQLGGAPVVRRDLLVGTDQAALPQPVVAVELADVVAP